jgi:hypothetical protein
MTANSNAATPAKKKSAWPQLAQFLFLVALAVDLYFLGLTIVFSRFQEDGQLDRHGHIGRKRHSSNC